MKPRSQLSDHEIMCMAVDYMPADTAWKFISFFTTCDFDVTDDAQDTAPTIAPYPAKLCCLLLAVECPTQH